jgi:undecaprenyl-phosphate 4-deoxy-4-formamido-L-arabinose transferase
LSASTKSVCPDGHRENYLPTRLPNGGSPEDKRTQDTPAPLISMVIPVYNEGEDVLDACLTAVRQVLENFGHPWEIIFIDDFSLDNSLDKLLTFVELDPRIKVISHSRNMGAVKAMLSGLRVSRGQIVIPFDPDLQFAPECIPQLAQQVLDGYDFAGGIRVNRSDSTLKRATSRIGSIILNYVMNIHQTDFGSIKAYSRRIVEGILSLPQDYMSLQAAAFTLSKNFIEIPIKHQPRMVGKSKWTFLMRLEYFIDAYTSYAAFPFSGVLLVGLGMLILGLVMGTGGAVYWLTSGRDLDMQFGGLTALSIFMTLVGANFATLALIGKFVVRGFRRKFQIGDEGYARILTSGRR